MSHLLILFGVTYGAALLATLPMPGLLNVNAKVSVNYGKKKGLGFSLHQQYGHHTGARCCYF